MPEKFREEKAAVLKFGGGVHSRASETEIDPRECKSGENFQLDLQNFDFRNRKPFDLIGTVPNGAEVRGGICLEKTDGTITTLFQAGDTVYEWDGATTFTSRGTVAATAKLRGRLEHNWNLDDKVIITDLNLAEEVMEWDGTTLSVISFTDESASAFGTFRAKYCYISNERAVFANVHDNGVNTPHLIVGTKRGQFENITVANRPSSALNEEDPFFLIQPDYRPINGITESFGKVITSSAGSKSSLFQLTGQSAKDFAFDQLYAGSAASGDESLAYAGNDTIYGRKGRIESVAATEKFGDVETDDLSVDIADQIEGYTSWTIVYNSRLQRVYCFPSGQEEVWVYHKPLAGSDLSPWSKWTTKHALKFTPTFVMNMLDPSDGLEYVFMGDGSGNIYRLEGSGTSGDGGTQEIESFRQSKLIEADLDSHAHNIQGWVRYRKNSALTLTLKVEYAGTSVFDETLTLTLPAPSGANYYGGGKYYGGGNYYGVAFQGRLTRKIFATPGKSNAFQLRATISSTADFEISEIGVRFVEAST